MGDRKSKAGVSGSSDRRSPEGMKARLRDALWTVWMPVAHIAAKGYVAGPHLTDALRVSEMLARREFGVTLCPWNSPDTPAEQVAETYHAALRGVPSGALDWYLSIKAPEIGYSLQLTQTVVAAAGQLGIGVHFDSHGPETADPTFDLVERLLPGASPLGCTLPGRWERSLRDAERVREWGVRVRVVKGQWREPGRRERDPRLGCLEVIECLAGNAQRVAVASHDPVLVRDGLTRLLKAGTPCELELLFGLPMVPVLNVARELGVGVRVYVPYGHAWLPYCFTQMVRNPRILWWLIRDMTFRRSARALAAGMGAASGPA